MSAINSILVPTDFSEVANNALEYASQVAQKLDASVTVFHSYRVSTLSQLPGSEVEERERVAEQEAHNRFEKLKKDLPGLEGLNPEFIATSGVGTDEILDTIKTLQVDLTIMGTHGASNIAEKLLGSVTANVLTKADCPVLSIPAKAAFKDIEKIAFATDYGEIEDTKELDTLVQFAQSFKAEIHVVKVEDEEYTPNIDEAKAVVKFDRHLDPVKHDYHLSTDDDIEEGLQNYIKENDIDMLAMMPRRHNIYERLFSGSVTKTMVYHTTIPLFGFHGEK